MKIITFLLLAAFMVCSSCGYREGIIQGADKSYLQFTGNLENATVQIDTMEPLMTRADEKKLYQVAPGKHAIKIYRDGRLLVDRVLLLENQTTMEVQIP